MTERILPGIGLTGYWDQGAPWKVGGDQNWLRSSVLTQLSVESTTTSLPPSPLNGVIYIVPVGDANANQVAARDNGAWVYMPPQEGWTAYVRDTGVLMNFDGAAWVPSTAPLSAALAADNGAALIGFKQQGAGAIARYVLDKLKDIVNTKDFGAVADGVTDDTAAVQAAVDFAIGLQQACVIDLPRNSLINGTINLNTGQTRFPLYFRGGSLKRTTSTGFMFDANVLDNNSDIFFVDVQFTSTAGAGAKIFNGDKIIRLQTRGCSFRGVDTVLAATTDGALSYAQSYRSIGDIVAGGGAGFAFDLVACFDTVFDNLLLEQRESGIRVRRYIYDLKITKSCLEGLTGSAIVLGDDVLACYNYQVLIEGCYFEANSVANIYIGTVHQRAGPITVRECVMLGAGAPTYAEYMISAGGYGSGGLFSERNYSDLGTVIDVTRISGNYAISRWDRNKAGFVYAIDPKLRVEGEQIYSTSGSVTTSRLGQFNRLYMASTPSIAASTTQQVSFNFATAICLDDIVTVQLQITNGTTLEVSHFYRQSNTVQVFITNKSAGAVNAPISVTVLKMPFTVSG